MNGKATSLNMNRGLRQLGNMNPEGKQIDINAEVKEQMDSANR